MFEDFLRRWTKEREYESSANIIDKYGEAYLLAWSFYFFLGKELRLSNKDHQALILDVISPRMFTNVDRSDYNQVLEAIKKECIIHSTK